MRSQDLREKFLKFFEENGHKIIPSAPLVPSEEQQLSGKEKVLFTSAGMQPLIPYLTGQMQPPSKRLVDVQKCLRTDDIEQVGDAIHHTFFEMLGNWSIGDYWKKEAIELSFKFLTEELRIPLEKLFISVFAGDKDAPRDEESAQIWHDLGVPDNKIIYLGKDHNWWPTARKEQDSGEYKNPIGPCGPDTEMFYWTGEGEPRGDPETNHSWIEIWNDVFMQFNRKENGTLEELFQKNVDTGMGLERTLAVLNGKKSAYETDLFTNLIEGINASLGAIDVKDVRIIADHVKASIFLLNEGIRPSNKEQGYVLRRLLRRAATKAFLVDRNKSDRKFFRTLVRFVTDIYPAYFERSNTEIIENEISEEIGKFRNTIERGLVEVEKRLSKYDKEGGWLDTPGNAAKFAFDMYQSYGLPMDAYFDPLLEKFGIVYAWGQREDLYKEFEKLRTQHSERSRTASAGRFKGGLAGHSEVETKYHTATHLLHQALRDVLGPEVFQKGSNITTERLRFDFSFERRLTDEEIKKVEDLVNQKIKEDLKVDRKFMTPGEAYKLNAIGLFNDKYAKEVSIYAIGPNYKLDPEAKDQRERGGYYSLEFCGGPHVEHTGVIGSIKVTKEDSVSAGIRRIYAELALSNLNRS